MNSHFKNSQHELGPGQQFAPPAKHAEGFQPVPNEGLLDDYLRTLSRHRRAILLCAVLGAAIALLFGLTSLPVYRTRTSLDIRSINNDFMNIRDVAPTGANTQADADINLQTQIKLLQSDTLLQAVMAKLVAEPHPASIPKEDMVSRIARAVHLGGLETMPYNELGG